MKKVKITNWFKRNMWWWIIVSNILFIGLIFLIGIISAQVGNHTLPSDILETCTSGLLFCFSDWASDVTTGMFWVFALFAFSFVIFLATLRLGTPRAFGFGSFVGLLGGVWLAILTLIPWWVASAFIIAGAIGISVLLISEKD